MSAPIRPAGFDMKIKRIHPTPAHKSPLKNISVSKTISVRTRFDPTTSWCAKIASERQGAATGGVKPAGNLRARILRIGACYSVVAQRRRPSHDVGGLPTHEQAHCPDHRRTLARRHR